MFPPSIVQDKKTPLMYAALNKSAQALAVVEVLLKAGAEVNARDKVSAWEGGMAHIYMWIYMRRAAKVHYCGVFNF